MNGSIDLRLHHKQGLALLSHATELGYGGAAGGGKSHLGRGSAIYFSHAIPGLNTYLFRRTNNELQKNHFVGPTSFPALLHPWTSSGYVEIVKNEIRFANGPDKKDPFTNGSKIFASHCQHEKDVFNWLGPEMHYLIIEQAEQFTPFMIQMLRGRNRIPEALNIPTEFKALFPRCLYTFNPGGVGHAFFKSKFVKALKRDNSGVSEIVEQPDDEGGKKRQFIQAKLDDNPSVNPVEYRKTLRGLPPRMAKALEEGDFDQVVGAFFPEIDRARHFIKRHFVPPHLMRIQGTDWGSCGEADPFSIGWWYVSDGTIKAINSVTNDVFTIPRGALVCYRSWYGRGLPKVTASLVGRGILSKENGEHVMVRVAGGDIDEKKGHGESLLEIFSQNGVNYQKADRRRQPGHMQFRERLVGKNDRPMIYWFEDFEVEVETIMNLQHDLHDPNDCTPFDDHCLDGDTLIETDTGIKAIKTMVGTSGFVRNHLGQLVPFERCKSYGIDEMIKLTFSDGATITCTPDHKLMNSNGTWEKAIDFIDQERYVYIPCDQSLFQKNVKSLTELDTIRSVPILRTPIDIIQSDCIGLCGNIITGQYRMACTFTTRIMTELITKLRTWSVSVRESISHIMQISQIGLSTGECRLSAFAPLPPNGIKARPEESGRRSIMTRKFEISFSRIAKWYADSAALHILRGFIMPHFAPISASQNGEEPRVVMMRFELASLVSESLKPTSTVQLKHAAKRVAQKANQLPRCVRIESVQRGETFCLDTPSPHSFLLANGIVVHNCYEQTRYVCMSRPWIEDEPQQPIDTVYKYQNPTINDLWPRQHTRR